MMHVLLAWEGETLVGLWALRERRFGFLPTFLAAPPYEYAFIASPVIDPKHANAVMPAFFDAIAKARNLPNVVELKLLDGDADSFRAMMSAIGGRPLLKVSEHTRPFLNDAAERKRSGSTGKKLRQDWNRLSALGAVDVVNERTADAARDAFEIFLKLESKSWKGENGTALLSNENDAAFARRWIAALAAHGSASVALLRVDEKPIAAQVLLYSGTMAYTWKTAFDAEFAKFSPGALLIDKVSDALFATGTETIEFVLAGRQLHGAALDRPPRDRRRAGRCRCAQVARLRARCVRRTGLHVRTRVPRQAARRRVAPAEAQEHRSHADLKPRDNISIPHAAVLPH